jgi:enamine deaminase RidA (YjgF/YER057c/UK114 family)
VTADGRRRAGSGSPFEASIGFSRAVRVGPRVVVSGTGPIWPDGSCPDDAGTQARRCFEIALAALAELGGTADDVIRTRMYLCAREDADAVGAAHREAFGRARPAATMVVVAGLLDPRWKVEIEAEALLADEGMPAESPNVR